MTRRKGDGPGSDGTAKLLEGIERLRSKGTAAKRVCREVLCLDAKPLKIDVIVAVHKAIHHAEKTYRESEFTDAASLAILAGAVLLKEFLVRG